MTAEWLWWRRISKEHFTARLLDEFIHVVKVGDAWFIRYQETLYYGTSDIHKAFDYAEGFAMGVIDKHKKEQSEAEVNGTKE